MNATDADKVVRGFLTQPNVKAWSQATIYGEWDVWVKFPGKQERAFTTLASAQAFWRQLVNEGVIAR